MPASKHWNHIDQDINRDPEFRGLAKKYGLGGVRFWLESLAILDRTDNYWELHKGFDLGLLAGSCETKRHIIQGSFEHLRDINWLRVGVNPDQKLFIYAPKWSEYNKRREDKGSMMDTTWEHKTLYPTPTPTPSPKKEIYKEKERPSTSRKKSQGGNTREVTKEFLDQLKNNPAYMDLDLVMLYRKEMLFSVQVRSLDVGARYPRQAK